MTQQEQIERIQQMEERFNRVNKAVEQLEEAFLAWSEVMDEREALDTYYSSGDWMTDYEFSESDDFPKDMPCGVLSEDGVWNMLYFEKELIRKIIRMGVDIM